MKICRMKKSRKKIKKLQLTGWNASKKIQFSYRKLKSSQLCCNFSSELRMQWCNVKTVAPLNELKALPLHVEVPILSKQTLLWEGKRWALSFQREEKRVDRRYSLPEVWKHTFLVCNTLFDAQSQIIFKLKNEHQLHLKSTRQAETNVHCHLSQQLERNPS